MAGCPGSTEDGCRCPEHDPGLREYARDPEAYDRALARLAPTRLQVVTLPPNDGPPCDGSMTCTCSACVQERLAAADRARGGEERADPFRPRASRHDRFRRHAA